MDPSKQNNKKELCKFIEKETEKKLMYSVRNMTKSQILFLENEKRMKENSYNDLTTATIDVNIKYITYF